LTANPRSDARVKSTGIEGADQKQKQQAQWNEASPWNLEANQVQQASYDGTNE